MSRWGLSIGFTLAAVSIAYGGGQRAVIELEASPGPPYTGMTSQQVSVNVYLRQDPVGADRYIRLAQIDVSNSSSELRRCLPPPLGTSAPATQGCLAPFQQHSSSCNGAVRFWNFSGTPDCIAAAANCSCGHYLEDQLIGAPRPGVLSSTYYFVSSSNLQQNTNAQRRLPGNGTRIKLGELIVTLPAGSGTYTLDVANALQTIPDDGGVDIRWGFGNDVDGNPLTTWRANTGEITGGTLEFCVGECAPKCSVNLVPASAVPTCDSTLPRTRRNIIRLTFDGTITDPAGAVEIRQLLEGGGLGATNLAASGFTISVESPTILRIQEDAVSFANKTWYGVKSDGWGSVCPFKINYATVRGDASNNKTTDVLDANSVLANRGLPTAVDSRFDIDGNGAEDVLDANAVLGNRGGAALPTKPMGHPCP